MNIKVSHFFKNVSYVLTSNIISLLISTTVTIFVPKIIGVEDYGYWQVYLFYASYVGFLHFGWNDGLYLKLGGAKYSELNKKELFSQFWSLFIFQIILATILVFWTKFQIFDDNREFIFQIISIDLIIVNTRYFIMYLLQATNRMQEYSKITILDRVFYLILIFVFILGGIKDFRVLVSADIMGKLVSLVYAILICKDIVIRSINDFRINLIEIFSNIKIGINLMFANIASSLIIGTVRFGIEQNWNVETFGKVSLTLSVSNLLMRFITAISLVIYPVLRRTESKKLPKIYKIINESLSYFLLGVLCLYFPLKLILENWLPNYSDTLEYMAIIFPMIVFEGKVVLLTNTFLKVLRKERVILRINIVTVILSLLLTALFAYILKNLFASMLSIVILIAFRSLVSEKYLSTILEVKLVKNMVHEIFLVIVFIIIAWNLEIAMGLLLYLLVYSMYLILNYKKIKEIYIILKK